MPEVNKLIPHAPAAGYNTIVITVWEGDPAEQIADTNPAYEYMAYIKDFTLLDMPSRTFVIFQLLCIVIPAIMRP